MVAILGPTMGSSRLWAPPQPPPCWPGSTRASESTPRPRPGRFPLCCARAARPAPRSHRRVASAIRKLEDQGATFALAMTIAQSGALVHELSVTSLAPSSSDKEAAARWKRQESAAYVPPPSATWHETSPRSADSTRRKSKRSNHSSTEAPTTAPPKQWPTAHCHGVPAPAAGSTRPNTRPDWRSTPRCRPSPRGNQADALCDLAAALEAAGHTEPAADAYADAIRRYDRKEHRVGGRAPESRPVIRCHVPRPPAQSAANAGAPPAAAV